MPVNRGGDARCPPQHDDQHSRLLLDGARRAASVQAVANHDAWQCGVYSGMAGRARAEDNDGRQRGGGRRDERPAVC